MPKVLRVRSGLARRCGGEVFRLFQSARARGHGGSVVSACVTMTSSRGAHRLAGVAALSAGLLLLALVALLWAALSLGLFSTPKKSTNPGSLADLCKFRYYIKIGIYSFIKILLCSIFLQFLGIKSLKIQIKVYS